MLGFTWPKIAHTAASCAGTTERSQCRRASGSPSGYPPGICGARVCAPSIARLAAWQRANFPSELQCPRLVQAHSQGITLQAAASICIQSYCKGA